MQTTPDFLGLLTTRTRHALMRAGIRSYDDFTEAVIQKRPLRGVGRTSVLEINSALSVIGSPDRVQLFEKVKYYDGFAWCLRFVSDAEAEDDLGHSAYLVKRKTEIIPKRDIQIYNFKTNGMKLGEIAKKFDLSPERVRQICVKVDRRIREKQRVRCETCAFYESAVFGYELLCAVMKPDDFCSKWRMRAC